MAINRQTTPVELAVLVSEQLEASGITATLSGGGAVSIYSENKYMSNDLDFVTSAPTEQLETILSPLGFHLSRDGRHFEHSETELYIEFPPGPLEFGDQPFSEQELPKLLTPFGELRVITQTLCVLDRLLAFWHWGDRQAWDQAVLVASSTEVDYEALEHHAGLEGQSPADIERLRSAANRAKG